MLELDLKPLKNYPGKTKSYIFTRESPVLKSDTESLDFSGPVTVDVQVTNSEHGFMVNGSVKGRVKLCCSRCLEEFLLPVEAEIDETYRLVYLQDRDYGTEDAQNKDIIPFKGDSIDITPEVIKSIFMSLPMKAVCDAACKGLCPQCGCNLNKEKCNCVVTDIDPRLAVLKGFLKDRE